MAEWTRRKLRCVRLKQRKRGRSMTSFLVRLGGSALAGAQAGRERSSGWWRMAGSPQVNEAMSNQWFREQGLVSLTGRYLALRY